MIPLKMNSGSNMCVAVTAAMAFNSTIKEFQKSIENEAPYSDLDFCKYAFKMGYICGFGISKEAFIKKINVGDSGDLNDTLEIQRDLTPESIIEVKFKLKDYPAYIVVENEIDKTIDHCIYWDSQQVWDPNPMVENGRNLNKYKILRYFPIIKLED